MDPRKSRAIKEQSLKWETVNRLLVLDENRELRWKSRADFNNQFTLSKVKAGCDHNGYTRIRIMGKAYMAHRLIYFLENKKWPDHDIDHVNGEIDDNSGTNIREATYSQNRQNLRKAQSNNRCGFLGVSSSPGKYRATISFTNEEGKKIRLSLGFFPTPEEAYAVYLEAKRQLHPYQTLVE